MVRVTAKGLGDDLLKFRFDFVDRLAGRKAGAVADPKDVGVNREGLLAKGRVENDVRGLAADPGQRLQLLARARHFAAMPVDQPLAECDDVPRLGVEQADRLDRVAQRAFAEIHHLLRFLDARKQRTASDIDARVGRLRRKHHRDEQLVRVFGLQLGRGRRVRLREPAEELENLLSLQALVSGARMTSCIE